MDQIVDIVYNSIVDTGVSWDFIRTCNPDDYSERDLQTIAWECGKSGLDCTGEEWHLAMDRMKYIANNYINNYK